MTGSELADDGPYGHARRLVVERFDYDDGRCVRVSVPRDPPEAVVFAGDGQLISQWGERLDAAGAIPTMIVGVDHAEGDARLQEYSLGFDDRRFVAHESFVMTEVRDWVTARFDIRPGPDRTAVCGASASGEFSLAMGLRHPDVFGAVFSASPGAGYRPPEVLPSPLPRTYLVAGTREPFFLENARRWSEALEDAGADVVQAERDGDHGDPFWAEELPAMVDWAFGRPAAA